MNRIVFIGDVHGMLHELKTLIEAFSPVTGDQIVFVGDLVDKGYDSPGVVKYIRELSLHYKVTVVAGNHEDKHQRYRRHLVASPEIAAQMSTYQPELAEITSKLSAADIGFMDSFSLFHRIQDHNILVVHGGIPGNMKAFPASQEDALLLKGREKKLFQRICRTREIDSKTGRSLTLKEVTPADRHWSDTYDGRFGHVIYGHSPFISGPKFEAHSTGIDTGCVFGGNLTGLVFYPDGTQSCISVPNAKFFNNKNDDI